jgi:hypothetical protein
MAEAMQSNHAGGVEPPGAGIVTRNQLKPLVAEQSGIPRLLLVAWRIENQSSL